MADLTITAANVERATNALIKRATASAAVTAGQSVYLDTNSQVALADADASDTANASGIAVNNAAANQDVNYVTEGDIDDIGGTMVVGETYVVSTTAGGIAPIGDLGIGDFTTILGIAETASKLKVNIFAGGVAKA